MWGFYTSAATNNSGSNLALYLSGSGNNPAGQTREGGSSWPVLQVGLAMTPFTGNSTTPKGYMRIKAYGSDGTALTGELNDQAFYLESGTTCQQLVSGEYTVQQDGYVRIFLGNESDGAVYFDNFEIKYQERLIVQENHYDPWGLNLAGIETQGSPNDKFQFLGQEKQTDFNLNWVETLFRSYDPQLGRFHQVDLLSDFFRSLSPYAYSYNNPISYSDPTGLSAEEAEDNGKSKRAARKRERQWQREMQKKVEIIRPILLQQVIIKIFLIKSRKKTSRH